MKDKRPKEFSDACFKVLCETQDIVNENVEYLSTCRQWHFGKYTFALCGFTSDDITAVAEAASASLQICDANDIANFVIDPVARCGGLIIVKVGQSFSETLSHLRPPKSRGENKALLRLVVEDSAVIMEDLGREVTFAGWKPKVFKTLKDAINCCTNTQKQQ